MLPQRAALSPQLVRPESVAGPAGVELRTCLSQRRAVVPSSDLVSRRRKDVVLLSQFIAPAAYFNDETYLLSSRSVVFMIGYHTKRCQNK